MNENTNGLIRDFVPKGTDFSTIANAEVAKVERLLNARPRKSLGFRSPHEVFGSLAHSLKASRSRRLTSSSLETCSVTVFISSAPFLARFDEGYQFGNLMRSASWPQRRQGCQRRFGLVGQEATVDHIVEAPIAG